MLYESHHEKWSIIFEFLLECKVKVLRLDRNFRSTILKEISPVCYIELRELHLANN
jgi:hypothetical protein